LRLTIIFNKETSQRRQNQQTLNAVVTCEIKLFRNYISLRRRPTKIIIFQRVETCLKLF